MKTLSWLLLVIVTSAKLLSADAFYPKGSISDFEQGWYAKHLSAMKEPVLGATGAAKGDFAFRVLYLPTWGRPVAVRIEKKGDRIVRRSVILTGDGGYDPGHIKSQKEENLSKDDFSAFRENLEKSGVLSLPVKDDVIGCDGSELIVEVLQDGKHIVFVRWTPECDTKERNLSAVVSFYQEIFQGAGFWKAEKTEPNKRPERNAGATSVPTSMPSAGVAHP